MAVVAYGFCHLLVQMGMLPCIWGGEWQNLKHILELLNSVALRVSKVASNLFWATLGEGVLFTLLSVIIAFGISKLIPGFLLRRLKRFCKGLCTHVPIIGPAILDFVKYFVPMTAFGLYSHTRNIFAAILEVPFTSFTAGDVTSRIQEYFKDSWKSACDPESLETRAQSYLLSYAVKQLGFTSKGVAAGSLAAAWHSSIGDAKSIPLFARMQSYAHAHNINDDLKWVMTLFLD